MCPHCGKDFSHKHCLNTHLLLHTTERPYQCGECKKCFTLKHHLLTHLRVHTRDRPFVCQECGRSFPLKRHLVTHSKFHAGERPFICEVNIKTFQLIIDTLVKQKNNLFNSGLWREFCSEGAFRHALEIPRLGQSICLQRLWRYICPKVSTYQSRKASRTCSTLLYNLRARVFAKANLGYTYEVSKDNCNCCVETNQYVL